MNNRVLKQAEHSTYNIMFINNVFCKYKISSYGCVQQLNFTCVSKVQFKYYKNYDCVSLVINGKCTGIMIPKDLSREEFVGGYFNYICDKVYLNRY